MQGCVPYTALFNIARKDVDGRKMEDYKDWLTKTIRIWPEITVFHDGCLDDFDFLSAKEHRVAVSEIKMFSKLDRVSRVIGAFQSQVPGDITFLLPMYSLVQFSKFELANRVLEHYPAATSVLWVDAGISRFIEEGSCSRVSELDRFANELITAGYNCAFEIDLNRNFQLIPPKLKYADTGTCRRVFSGTSFWLSKVGAAHLERISNEHMENWLYQSVWDNEQVFLRQVAAELERLSSRFYIQGREMTGSVARAFLSGHVKSKPIRNWLVSSALAQEKQGLT